jgi:hypothetical protein
MVFLWHRKISGKVITARKMKTRVNFGPTNCYIAWTASISLTDKIMLLILATGAINKRHRFTIT